MDEEIQTLQENRMWMIVYLEKHMNVMGSRWVFKTKLKANGTLDKLKARLVTHGFM